MFPVRPAPHPHSVGIETRQALIAAATEVFLAQGFRAARVKDITDRAGARLSAINYHFGGKEGLYLAVLQHHAEIAVTRTPLPEFDAGQPLETRFRAFVRTMVFRMVDPANPSRIGSLMVREAINPTPALEVMFERFSRPQSEALFGLMREHFGPDASYDLLARASLSVVGQIMVYVALKPLVLKLRPDLYTRTDGLDELAEQVAIFSWAGLYALLQVEASRHES